MALKQRIESLKKRRAELDLKIHSEEARPAPDTMRLHQLKTEKLNMKDELVRLTQHAA